MLSNESLFFIFIILFFLIISLVKSWMEKMLMRWVYTLKLWIRATVILVLVTVVFYLLFPYPTKVVLATIVDVSFVLFDATVEAFGVFVSKIAEH